jgi:hypothetical protein
MFRFTVKFLGFLLPVLLALFWLDGRMGALPTSYSEKKVRLEAQLPLIEVLMLGNSHAYYGLDPHALRWRGFNLANVSQPLQMDAALLERYLPVLPRLRAVVIGISYHSFWFDASITKEEWRRGFYERIFGIPAPYPWWSARHYSWIALYGDPRRAAEELIERTRAPNTYDRYDAWGKVLPNKHLEDAIDDEHAQARVAVTHIQMRAEAYVDNVSAVRSLCANLRHHGILAIMVTLPVTGAFGRNANPQGVAEMARTASGLARETGARYFNYFNAPGFVDGDFLDVDHLGPTGAGKVGQLLDADLVSSVPGYTTPVPLGAKVDAGASPSARPF